MNRSTLKTNMVFQSRLVFRCIQRVQCVLSKPFSTVPVASALSASVELSKMSDFKEATKKFASGRFNDASIQLSSMLDFLQYAPPLMGIEVRWKLADSHQAMGDLEAEEAHRRLILLSATAETKESAQSALNFCLLRASKFQLLDEALTSPPGVGLTSTVQRTLLSGTAAILQRNAAAARSELESLQALLDQAILTLQTAHGTDTISTLVFTNSDQDPSAAVEWLTTMRGNCHTLLGEVYGYLLTNQTTDVSDSNDCAAPSTPKPEVTINTSRDSLESLVADATSDLEQPPKSEHTTATSSVTEPLAPVEKSLPVQNELQTKAEAHFLAAISDTQAIISSKNFTIDRRVDIIRFESMLNAHVSAGDYFTATGKITESSEVLTKALKAVERQFGQDDSRIATCLTALASNFANQSLAVEAEGLFRSALAKARSVQPFTFRAQVNLLMITQHYSIYLSKLKWNKKSRAQEGVKLLTTEIESAKRRFPKQASIDLSSYKSAYRTHAMIPSWLYEMYR